MAEDEHSIFVGAVYILVLSALLFWLPLIGPFIAGYLGGRKAGSLAGGVMAGVVPAAVVGLLTYLFVNALPDLSPGLAALVGGVAFIWVVGNMAGAIAAAAVGGYAEEQGAPA